MRSDDGPDGVCVPFRSFEIELLVCSELGIVHQSAPDKRLSQFRLNIALQQV